MDTMLPLIGWAGSAAADWPITRCSETDWTWWPRQDGRTQEKRFCTSTGSSLLHLSSWISLTSSLYPPPVLHLPSSSYPSIHNKTTSEDRGVLPEGHQRITLPPPAGQSHLSPHNTWTCKSPEPSKPRWNGVEVLPCLVPSIKTQLIFQPDECPTNRFFVTRDNNIVLSTCIAEIQRKHGCLTFRIIISTIFESNPKLPQTVPSHNDHVYG